MNITILANKDLASCVALNHLVAGLQAHDLRIFLSARLGNDSQLPRQLLDLKFFEQSLFNELLFPALASSTSANAAELLGFSQLGEAIGKPIEELNRINSGEDFHRFQQSEPDLVLSIRYGVILKDPVIAIPQHGVLNLHSGLLPSYKGVMATFRAMLNGEQEIGTTLHYIEDSSIDTGRIIGMTRMPVDPRHCYMWHVLQLYTDGCALMLDTIARVENSKPVQCHVQEAAGNYYSFPDESELAQFAARGYKLIDPVEVLEVARKFLPSQEL